MSQDGNENGHEKKAEEDDTEPTPVGFWDPALKKVRNRAMGKWLITTAMLMAFILCVLSLYWAVFFRLETRLKHLRVYVVDFDGQAPYETNTPLVGPAITQLAQGMVDSGKPTLGFDVRSASEFGGDPLRVREAIYDFDAWAAIVVNPNATAMLYSAIETGNASYEPLGACQLVYLAARDNTNWLDFMQPVLNSFMTEAQSMVGRQWAMMVLQQASDDATTLANMQAVPQAINPAIGFSQYDLRPFYPYTGIPAVSIGLIYLIILSFFSFSFYMPIHMQYLSPKGHPPLRFRQLILWRWLATSIAYLFLSLAYSFVSLAFQINFSTTNPITSHTLVTETSYGNPPAFGHATFVIYWLLNFWGMMALGLACENVAMVVGAPWMGMWLIFWVITNVATAFYDVQVAPAFFRWGYAWPLHSVVEGSRALLFDLHSRLGIDFGILIAWAVVNTLLFPLCCWFQRWKTQRGVHEYWPME